MRAVRAPQNPTPFSRIRREQGLDVAKKDRDLRFDRAPNEFVVDEVVAVDQDVAKAAASRMSSSNFGDRGCIDRLARLVDGLDEIRIFQRADHHEVDFAAEQRFEIFLQSEVAVKEALVAIGIEIDKKIEIARLRIKGPSGCGAEQLQLANAIATAQGGNFRALSFNQWLHIITRADYTLGVGSRERRAKIIRVVVNFSRPKTRRGPAV
jgi:hypothetical protein